MGKYVTFKGDSYTQKLQEVLAIALKQISDNVYRSMLLKLSQVHVRQADRGYMRDVANSIRYSTINTLNTFSSSFNAGGDTRPNQSFRAIYYEYGTGTEMNPPGGYSPSSDPYRNPARKGRDIYQRPASSWWDMGGNRHTSRTRGKPKPLPKNSLYGEEVKPHYWFRQGFLEGTKDFDSIVLQYVKSVPISSYINIRDMVKRM